VDRTTTIPIDLIERPSTGLLHLNHQRRDSRPSLSPSSTHGMSRSWKSRLRKIVRMYCLRTNSAGTPAASRRRAWSPKTSAAALLPEESTVDPSEVTATGWRDGFLFPTCGLSAVELRSMGKPRVRPLSCRDGDGLQMWGWPLTPVQNRWSSVPRQVRDRPVSRSSTAILELNPQCEDHR